MSSNTTEPQAKPTKYYIDFENVHGAGLKGVDALTERDEVVIVYSQAAETFHIEHAIDILKSQARIRFVEADAGTRNAADFQLIVALYADMDDAYDYAIVSGDGGFDAAIKMGERMGKPPVRRLGNIAGDEAEPEKPKSRRSRRSRSGRDTAKDAATEPEAPAQGEAAAETAESPTPEAEAKEAPSAADEVVEHDEVQAASQEDDPKPSSSRRRSRRRQSPKRASTRKETDDAYARAAEAMRLASESASAHGAAATEKPEPQPEPVAAAAQDPDAPATPGSTAPAGKDTATLVKELLEEKGVQLSDAQIATVASALDGPDGRQGFYRRIIKIERQQNGRVLYRQVREHYEALLQAIGK